MSTIRLTKPQKTLTAIIESEGARILSLERGGNHIQCSFTFDDNHVFTQSLPYGAKEVDRRWTMNFRSTIRKTKRQLLEN